MSDTEAAFLPFETHADAMQALRSCGFGGEAVASAVDCGALLPALETILRDKGWSMQDATKAIPGTSAAAYKALALSCVSALQSSKKDKRAAFSIFLTPENAPSFLFGMHWTLSQKVGTSEATALLSKSKPSVAFFFANGRQIELPCTASRAESTVLGRMIASQITEDASLFQCGICGTPCARTSEQGRIVAEEVAVDAEGDVYLATCARAQCGPQMELPFKALESSC